MVLLEALADLDRKESFNKRILDLVNSYAYLEKCERNLDNATKALQGAEDYFKWFIGLGSDYGLGNYQSRLVKLDGEIYQITAGAALECVTIKAVPVLNFG
jgi:hypothetical protein